MLVSFKLGAFITIILVAVGAGVIIAWFPETAKTIAEWIWNLGAGQ